MMVLKIFFTETEILQFFKDNNFVTAPFMRGNWVTSYHNRSEWIETEAPGIVVDGRVVDAEKVFEKVVESRLKKTIAPINLETKRIINLIAKKL